MRERGGLSKGIVRRNRYQEEAMRAEEELEAYKVGEPSGAFYPTLVEPEQDVEAHVVFDSLLVQSNTVIREADRAKRRAEAINDVLLIPLETGPIHGGNLNFLRRHIGRARKFARTLMNKNQPLNPTIRRYLKV